MTPIGRRKVWLSLVVVLLTSGWAMMMAAPHRAGQASYLDPIESSLVNLRFATFGAAPADPRVVIIAIDDAMMASTNPLGQGRNTLAALIDALVAQGAAVVALDILLSDQHDLENDRALARALANAPSVIAAAGQVEPNAPANSLPRLSQVLQPQAAFKTAADIGIVNISTDPSGVPRHIPIVFLTQDGLQPSFAAQASSVFLDEPLQLSDDTLTLGAHEVPLDIGFQMPLRLLGPQATVTTVSAASVMNAAFDIDLNGKLALVGVTATALGDRFPSPFDPSLPGVEVMGSAISQMMGGNGLRRDTTVRQFDMTSAVVLAVVCALLTLSLPLTVGVSLATGALIAWMGLIWLAFSFGIWMSAALPLAAAGPPILAGALMRYAHEKRHAALADRAVVELKKFQSPILADRIAENPDFLAAPEHQDLIVCFVDLSGFTQLSQDLGAQRSEAFLKRFHAMLADTAEDCDGMVLNFMGDGALLVFGVFEMSDHTANIALEAAFEMVDRTRKLGETEGLSTPLGLRVGLHFGLVILSRMGGSQHQQLTITGDSVNLCSRLLEVSKTHQTTIVATGEFLDQTTSPPPHAVDLETTLPVRGRSGEVKLSMWRF